MGTLRFFSSLSTGKENNFTLVGIEESIEGNLSLMCIGPFYSEEDAAKALENYRNTGIEGADAFDIYSSRPKLVRNFHRNIPKPAKSQGPEEPSPVVETKPIVMIETIVEPSLIPSPTSPASLLL